MLFPRAKWFQYIILVFLVCIGLRFSVGVTPLVGLSILYDMAVWFIGVSVLVAFARQGMPEVMIVIMAAAYVITVFFLGVMLNVWTCDGQCISFS
jgi:hypothetical protein